MDQIREISRKARFLPEARPLRHRYFVYFPATPFPSYPLFPNVLRLLITLNRFSSICRNKRRDKYTNK